MKHRALSLALAGVLACSAPLALVACGATGSAGADSAAGSQAAQSAQSTQDTASSSAADASSSSASTADSAASTTSQAATPLSDGTYTIEVTTDSSMFRSEACKLIVSNDEYVAELSLPGEGFSRLYFGTAEQAANANEDDVYDYYINDDGLYTFKVPVSALDQELPIAAFGHRRDKWYDHTIVFHAPSQDGAQQPADQASAE